MQREASNSSTNSQLEHWQQSVEDNRNIIDVNSRRETRNSRNASNSRDAYNITSISRDSNSNREMQETELCGRLQLVSFRGNSREILQNGEKFVKKTLRDLKSPIFLNPIDFSQFYKSIRLWKSNAVIVR
jgi:hypothetical protein